MRARSTPLRGMCVGLAVMALAGCGRPQPPAVPASPAVVVPDAVRIRSAGRIVTVPLEEYVLGTVLAEIAPSNDSPEVVARIYQLQAIISRTYAAFHRNRHQSEGFDLCDDTHCQVYRPDRIGASRYTRDARRAVDDTRGTILTYGVRPVEALFHADCGGHTADAEDVWGNPVPYLVGTADRVPERTHRSWTFEASREQLRNALNASTRTRVGGQLRSLRIATRDASGRVASLEVAGDEVRDVRGEHLRAAVNQLHGALAVRSTRFALNRDGDTYRFTGTGWGHGVGLCQVGAMARLRRGERVADVLATYYPGVRLLRTS